MIVTGTLTLLIALSAFQTAYVFLYSRRLRQSPSTGAPFLPPATVIICMRGKDPSLGDCLKSIFRQDYPDFRVMLVFDSEVDPAYEFVQTLLANHSPSAPACQTLVFKPELGASLKCQALCAAIDELTPATQVVALIDTDGIVNSNWLRDLVSPLSDKSIGATTGNRFFPANPPAVGGRLKHVWNAAAVVQMMLYQIAWGGSVAIRRSVLEQSDLLSRWRTAFCEDTMLSRVLSQNGWQLYRVPNLIVSNHETTDLGPAYRWIVRQLLTSRLYVRWWPLVFGHAIAVGAAILLPLISAIVLAVSQSWSLLAGLMIAFVIYQAVNASLLMWINQLNQAALDKQPTPAGDRRPQDLPTKHWLWNHLDALLLSQIVQPIAAIHAMALQTVQWRGIRYSVSSKERISLQRYTPYQTQPNDEENLSIE